MIHRKPLIYVFCFLGMVLSITACENEEVPHVFVGEWNIDLIEIYYEENGEVISVQYEDVGEFILREGGIGNATVATPGSSLPRNQPILWFYDEEQQQLTIDYDGTAGPDIYDVEFVSLSVLKWIYKPTGTTRITVSRK